MSLKMLGELETLNRFIGKIEYRFCIVSMGLTTIITILQVIARYAFNHPFTWPEELSTLLMVWMTFFGASLLLKEGKHVEVDFFFNYLPKKVQPLITLLINFLILAFMVVVVYGAYNLQFFQSRHSTVALRIPKNFFSLPVLVTGVSMCLFMLFAIIRLLNQIFNCQRSEKG